MASLFPNLSANLVKVSAWHDRMDNHRALFQHRQMLIDFYECNQLEEDSYFKQWGFSSKDALPLATNDLTQRVINRLAMVYKKPPTREVLSDSDVLIESEVNEAYQELGINVALKYLERYSNLLHNVLLRFSFVEELGRIRVYIDTEYLPEFTAKDSLFPVAYHILLDQETSSKGETELRYLFVSDDDIYVHDAHGTKVQDEGIGNPYGRLPVVDYSPFPIWSYWSLGERALVDANRQLNIDLANVAYANHFQCFDQPWGAGMDEKEAEKLKLGPDELPVLNDPNASLNLLGYSSKVEAAMAYVEKRLQMTLANYGMKADMNEKGQPQSGFAIKLSNLELLERRTQQIDDVFRHREQDIYEIVRSMNDYHKLGFNLPEGRLRVDFPEVDFPLSPEEERSQVDWELKKNLTTLAKVLMARNPDLSEDEAEEIITTNAEKNNTGRSLFGALFQDDGQEEIEA